MIPPQIKKRIGKVSFRIRTNAWGNTYAYIGRRRIKLLSHMSNAEIMSWENRASLNLALCQLRKMKPKRKAWTSDELNIIKHLPIKKP